MNGLISYNTLNNMPFAEALEKIAKSGKLNFGSMTVDQLAVGTAIPVLKTYEGWQQQLFGYGAYIFFDGDMPVYVGKAKDFLHRFNSMRFFDGRPAWAFNELPRKLAEIKLCNRDLAFNKESFHQQVMPEVERLNLIRINLSESNMPMKKMARLENLLRKGFADTPYGSLYNGLPNAAHYDNNKTLEQLMK